MNFVIQLLHPFISHGTTTINIGKERPQSASWLHRLSRHRGNGFDPFSCPFGIEEDAQRAIIKGS